MDKLAFWKKKDDMPDFGKDLGMNSPQNFGQDNMGFNPNIGMPDINPNMGMPDVNQGMPNFDSSTDFNPYNQNQYGQQNQFNQQMQGFRQAPRETAPPGFQSTPIIQQQPQQDFHMMSRDIEILSYKLDTIKAALDMVSQRLANIERIAMDERRKQW